MTDPVAVPEPSEDKGVPEPHPGKKWEYIGALEQPQVLDIL